MLPMLQVLKRCHPDAYVAAVVVPLSSEILHGHPAVDEIIVYDKHGADKGVRGYLGIMRRIRDLHCDLALIPHRSLRSALACWQARVSRRVGFSTSAGGVLFTSVIPYDVHSHEIDRNLHLLRGVQSCDEVPELPQLYPSAAQTSRVDALMVGWFGRSSGAVQSMVAIAPGSVWNTKRWPAEHYRELVCTLAGQGTTVLLLGGPGDQSLCSEIMRELTEAGCFPQLASCHSWSLPI